MKIGLSRWHWRILLFISSAILVFSLAWPIKPYEPVMMTSMALLLFLSLIIVGVILDRLPLSDMLLLVLILIPIDLQSAYPFLPPLSLVDFLALIAGVLLFRRMRDISLFRTIQMNIGWATALCWGLFLIYSLGITVFYGGSIRPCLRWGEFIFFVVLALLARQEDNSFQLHLASTLSIIGALCGIVALYQSVIAKGDYTQVYAAFRQHNGLGAYLSLTAPASWFMVFHYQRHRRWGWLPLALLNSLAFVVAFSRGAWLGILLGLLVVSLWQRCTSDHQSIWRGLIIGFMSIVIAFPLAYIAYRPEKGEVHFTTESRPNINPGSDPLFARGFWTSSQRPYYWATARAMIQSSPWRGVGPGQYCHSVRRYLQGEARHLYDYELAEKRRADFWIHLHSMYLQMLVEYGWIGFSLWVLAMAFLIAPSFAVREATLSWRPFFLVSVTAFLVHNTVDILFVSSMDLLFVTLLIASRPSNAKYL